MMAQNILCHYGVLGMRWGVRRYQPYSINPRKSGKNGVYVGRNKNEPSYMEAVNTLTRKDLRKLSLSARRQVKKQRKESIDNYVDVASSLSKRDALYYSNGDLDWFLQHNRDWAERLIKTLPDSNSYAPAKYIVSKHGNVTMAEVRYDRFSDNHEWNLSWMTNPNRRGSGVTQENIQEVVGFVKKHSKGQYRPKRFSAYIRPDNTASRRTAEKAGMVFERIDKDGNCVYTMPA